MQNSVLFLWKSNNVIAEAWRVTKHITAVADLEGVPNYFNFMWNLMNNQAKC